jgi:tryptophanyl-tRNA synthetase
MAPPPQGKPRVLSGIQPSGELHIGNWLGAVRTWTQQVAEGGEELLFCIVDAHAITVEYEPGELVRRVEATSASTPSLPGTSPTSRRSAICSA